MNHTMAVRADDGKVLDSGLSNTCCVRQGHQVMDFAVVHRSRSVDASERESAHFAIERRGPSLLHQHNRPLTLALKVLDQSPLPLVNRSRMNVNVEGDRLLRGVDPDVPGEGRYPWFANADLLADAERRPSVIQFSCEADVAVGVEESGGKPRERRVPVSIVAVPDLLGVNAPLGLKANGLVTIERCLCPSVHVSPAKVPNNN